MKCGLLGRHLGHSYSPAIHSMLADYNYQLFEVEPDALEGFLKNNGHFFPMVIGVRKGAQE